jgi:hypothetical protein
VSGAGMQAVQGRDIARRSGRVALAGVATVLAVHALRGDLDRQRAPLSLYLLGEHGLWLKAAYFALAAAIAGLGVGGYVALEKDTHSAAPLLLFAAAAVALCTTAAADSRPPGRVPTLANFAHGVKTQTTFLCVTMAMLLQSRRMRLDAAWRHRFAPAFALAALAFTALWRHALWSAAPRGLQRAVVVLVLAWLALCAYWLSRTRARAT